MKLLPSLLTLSWLVPTPSSALLIERECPLEKRLAAIARESPTRLETENSSIRDTLGVIVLDPKGYHKNHIVKLYNDDGSLWWRYSFFDNESEHSLRNDFRPFAFHQDYFLMVLKCLRRKGDSYEVFVNESMNLKKWVRLNDGNLKFQAWQSHVLKVFSVEFDNSKNPIRKHISGQVLVTRPPKHSIFQPIRISGSWMRIRWASSDQPNKVLGYGWIRWRDRNNLFVEPFYFA